MEFTDKSLEPFGETLLEMAVPTQIAFKTPLVFRVIKELTQRGYLPWTGSHRAELCLDEALTNAMIHGNKLNAAKQVRLTVFGDKDRWGAIIEDEGNGFGAADVPDPAGRDYLARESGRGILLIDRYVDGLYYSRKGNKLLMVRRRQTEPDPVEAQAALAVTEAPPAAGPVSTEVEEGVAVATINDPRISEDNSAAIRDAVSALVGPGKIVVMDLSHVEYVSSVGIGAFVTVNRRASADKGRLILAGAQPAVLDIFNAANMLKLFQMVPDRKSALRLALKLGGA